MFGQTTMLSSGDTDDFEVSQAPQVDIGGPYSGTWNQPIQLNATVTENSGQNITLTWSSDRQGVFSDPHVTATTFTPHSSGTYVLTLTLTGSNFAPIVDTVTVEVTAVAPTVTIVTQPVPVKVGSSVSVVAEVTTGSDPNPSISWDVTGGSYSYVSGQSTTNYYYIPNQIGQYTVTVTVTAADSNTAVSDAATFSVIAPPTVFPKFLSNTAVDGTPSGFYIVDENNSVNTYLLCDHSFSTEHVVSGTYVELGRSNVSNPMPSGTTFWVNNTGNSSFTWHIESSSPYPGSDFFPITSPKTCAPNTFSHATINPRDLFTLRLVVSPGAVISQWGLY